MDDISIILESAHEYFLKGLKKKYITLIICLILVSIIVFFPKLIFLSNIKTKSIEKIFDNKLFKLIFIGIIIYLYKYNKQISFCLFLFYIFIAISYSKTKKKEEKNVINLHNIIKIY